MRYRWVPIAILAISLALSFSSPPHSAFAATTATVDSTGDVGSSTSIAIKQGLIGLPIISYSDNTNGDLKVVSCGNASCTSGNIINTVDSTGSVGYNSSIAIMPSGLPII